MLKSVSNKRWRNRGRPKPLTPGAGLDARCGHGLKVVALRMEKQPTQEAHRQRLEPNSHLFIPTLEVGFFSFLIFPREVFQDECLWLEEMQAFLTSCTSSRVWEVGREREEERRQVGGKERMKEIKTAQRRKKYIKESSNKEHMSATWKHCKWDH